MSNELRRYRMQMLEDSRNAVDRAEHVLEVLDRQLEQLNDSSQSLALMRTGLDAVAGHADALVMMTAEFLPSIIDALALNADGSKASSTCSPTRGQPVRRRCTATAPTLFAPAGLMTPRAI